MCLFYLTIKAQFSHTHTDTDTHTHAHQLTKIYRGISASYTMNKSYHLSLWISKPGMTRVIHCHCCLTQITAYLALQEILPKSTGVSFLLNPSFGKEIQGNPSHNISCNVQIDRQAHRLHHQSLRTFLADTTNCMPSWTIPYSLSQLWVTLLFSNNDF
jgi:hypothetical protein